MSDDDQSQPAASPDLPRRIAHELRTPLGVLTSVHAQLATSADSGSMAPRMLEMAQRATAQIVRLADRLAMLSRVERGLDPQANAMLVELGTVVRDAVDAVGRARHRRAVTVEVEAGAGLHENVRCDPALLAFAIAELVDNAVRFAASTVSVRANTIDEARVRLLVQDDGSGLDEEAIRLIGHPDKAAGSRSGLGLGTALAKRIVHAYGGTLVVHSPAGPTVVAIDLPIVRS